MAPRAPGPALMGSPGGRQRVERGLEGLPTAIWLVSVRFRLAGSAGTGPRARASPHSCCYRVHRVPGHGSRTGSCQSGAPGGHERARRVPLSAAEARQTAVPEGPSPTAALKRAPALTARAWWAGSRTGEGTCPTATRLRRTDQARGCPTDWRRGTRWPGPCPAGAPSQERGCRGRRQLPAVAVAAIGILREAASNTRLKRKSGGLNHPQKSFR